MDHFYFVSSSLVVYFIYILKGFYNIVLALCYTIMQTSHNYAYLPPSLASPPPIPHLTSLRRSSHYISIAPLPAASHQPAIYTSMLSSCH